MDTRIEVQNLLSDNGNPVPNQFEIYTEEGRYFQSYSTTIAFKRTQALAYTYDKMGNKPIYAILDPEYWDYSKTTLKYLCRFLGEPNKASIQKKIDSGEYKLVSLNR